ncbi:MAG: lysine--tRNA ligase, partial [Butyricicoccus sp.]|nr:lysine--tRNA ligase [Butyricicoccus sp.]
MDQNAAAEQSKPKNAKPVRSESEEYEIRTAKLQAMQEEGKDPFTEVRFDRTNYTTDITENFEEMEGKIVRLAGRMMSKRV